MKRPKVRPGISEHDALVIAHAFVMSEMGELPVCDGAEYEGNPGAKWVIRYRMPVAKGAVMDPSHVFVVVDIETRTAGWLVSL